MNMLYVRYSVADMVAAHGCCVTSQLQQKFGLNCGELYYQVPIKSYNEWRPVYIGLPRPTGQYPLLHQIEYLN
jgi:hypothetical protein